MPDTDLAIPTRLREQVDERDRGYCRMCGVFLGQRRAIHHIFYGGDLIGIGGKRNHQLDNLVSLCWLPGDNLCHQRAHTSKHIWQPLLAAVVAAEPMIRTTAMSLRRRQLREQGNGNG